MYYKGRKNDTRHGVGIVVTEEISKYVEKVYYVSERIIGIRTNMKQVRQGIIQIYAPQQGRPAEEKDKHDHRQHWHHLLYCIALR